MDYVAPVYVINVGSTPLILLSKNLLPSQAFLQIGFGKFRLVDCCQLGVYRQARKLAGPALQIHIKSVDC